MGKTTSVFWITLIIMILLAGWGVIAPDMFENVTGAVMNYISVHFGWYYLIVVASILLFCFYLIISPYGKIKLGREGDKPEFSYPSWFAMLFSAGMGIGLVFYGISEPLSNYVTDPPFGEPGTEAAQGDALRLSFFHYGIHAWAVYAAMAMVLSYFTYRLQKPGLISSSLEPIFGDKVKGGLGKVIDILGVFATIVGVATSLGFGASQINGGLGFLFDIPQSFWMKLLIIGIVTVLFMISAYTGISKGIRYLSNANLIVGAILCIAVLFIGPTVYILNAFTENIGTYIQTLPSESLRMAFANADERAWIMDWTVFFWAWWIAWSPFVGIFIARISKGRTIREFLSGVLFVPAIVSFIWFTVFGASGMDGQDKGHDLASLPQAQQLFGLFDTLPLGMILSIVAILLITTFFITSADSATFVLGMQTTNGSLSPDTSVKIVWGFIQSGIAAVLLYTGGLQALQNALISAALPFSVIFLLMVFSFFKTLRKDYAKKY